MRRGVGAQSEVPAMWTLVPDLDWCDVPVPTKTIFYSCPLVERQGYGRAHPTRFIVRPRTLALGVQLSPRRPRESSRGASLTALRVCTPRAGETIYWEIPMCEQAGQKTVNHGLIARERGVA